MTVNLCFFLKSGKTFSFKQAKIDVDNETTIVFTYRAMSDDNIKTGVFQKSQLVGYSYFEPK